MKDALSYQEEPLHSTNCFTRDNNYYVHDNVSDSETFIVWKLYITLEGRD